MTRVEHWTTVPLFTIDGRTLGDVRCNVDRRQFTYHRVYSPYQPPLPQVGEQCRLDYNSEIIEIIGIGIDDVGHTVYAYEVVARRIADTLHHDPVCDDDHHAAHEDSHDAGC